MITTEAAHEEMEAQTEIGKGAARGNAIGHRLVAVIEAETKTPAPGETTPQLAVDGRVLPTQQHHETKPTTLNNETRSRPPRLLPKMLKYAHPYNPIF